jgi:phosphatidylserine/phosphatidylglycerophosphate/cardiolipin synthase-like enzyme
MFTFTHPILTETLIKAKKRGVDVKVAIDFESKKGASNKTIERLKNENIAIFFNPDSKLCHHKYILLDNKTLICGSANWTKSAFNKNFDCFLILYNLDDKQKKFMTKLWKTIQLESTLLN